ncbi:uncharacterized protein LOC143019865 [Oratosquilla oratoria]|uniref:uncharacterized protein LOC143019865 n=1 Tax=Oratosquilla oratoria TaxID=337810 RepID=UPI003F7684BA
MSDYQSGCFFHLTQCIQRKIQSIGLQNQYRNDYETFQYCRMLPALAFVPPADVIDAFETLADEMPDELTPLLDYFEDNYVGRPNRRGVRRTPLFPIQLWNMHQRVLDEEDRTTNAVEAWHRGLPTFLGATHPTIWKFIKGIRRIQKTKDVEIEQLVAGNAARGRRPIYERLDERIMNIVEDYENRDILDYLRGISHNIVPY